MRFFLTFLNFLSKSFFYSSHLAYPQSSPSGSQTKTIVCRKSWVGLLASVEMIGWKIKWLPGLGGLGPPAHQTDLTSTDGMFWAPFNGSVSTSLLPIIPPPSPRTIRFLDITFSWLGRGWMGTWSMQCKSDHCLTYPCHLLTNSLLFSRLDACEWCQLFDDLATAIQSCSQH